MKSIETEAYPSLEIPIRQKTIWQNLPSLKTLMVLFKFRIVILLLTTAIGGTFLGAGAWPGLDTLLLIVVTGGLAAAGASAFNQYLERDSDALMKRTKKRPLVDGTMNPTWVPYIAAAMIFIPSLLVLPFNPPLTFFLLLGATIYIILYTIYLKPRTLLNIVIGGAAGSAAVLSGSAAAGHWNDPGAIVLAFLIFLWTPTHFWSLAIMYREDYVQGGFPMLPAQTTPKAAAWWVFVHTIPTAFAALILTVHPVLGWLYFIPVAGATLDLVRRNIRLIQEPTPKPALSLFKISNLYLGLIILMICLDTVI